MRQQIDQNAVRQCFCRGPHTLCPCKGRDQMFDRATGVDIKPRTGWMCPNCGKAHAPSVKTCPEADWTPFQ